jgi:hypothetical protein
VIRLGVDVKLFNLRRYQENLDKLELVVMATAATIEADAKQSIMESSGQWKPYPRGGKIHWSAPPGVPPNTDTGYLANSIKHRRINSSTAEINVGAEYGIPLEIGHITEAGHHVPARPFLVPAVRRHEKAFIKAVRSILYGRM